MCWHHHLERVTGTLDTKTRCSQFALSTPSRNVESSSSGSEISHVFRISITVPKWHLRLYCNLWVPEGWDGHCAWGYGWDPGICGSWRSAVARPPGHWVLSVLLPQHPSRQLPHSPLVFLPHLTSHSFFLDLLLSSICSCSKYVWMVRLFQTAFQELETENE